MRSAGFAQRFGECLGEERTLKMLRDDPRPSVKYYLIKGLWDVQVSFRRVCLETARDVVVDGIAGTPRPWGARLALQVGADVETGQEFLVDLKEHLPLRAVLRGMGHHSSPEAQVEFHRLARALYPEAADQYARQFNVDVFLEPLAGAPPVTAIECCREVGRTLADAGYHEGGRDIVKAADRVIGEMDAWSNRLARTRTGEQLAQALNIFLDIDRPTTRSVVAALGQRVLKSDGGEGEGESLLIWKTRQAMFDSSTAAASLLSSLEETDAGLGSTIYAYLRQNPVLMQVFTYELQLLQSPSVQYTAARQLAAIGVLPHRADTEWMRQVAFVKQGFVRTLANPRLLTDIIRMLGIWSQSWADNAVRSVDHARLSTRLRLGLSRDISPAVALAGLHYDFRHPAGSELVLDALSNLAPSRIVECVGLRQACLLLELTRILRPADAGPLAAAIDASIGSQLDRAVVLDERHQWVEIGYAGHSLTSAGFPVTVTNASRTVLNIHHPAEGIWGLWHLPQSAWRRRSLSVMIDRLFADPSANGSSLFCVLAAASVTGRVDEVRNLAEEARVARLTFRQLRVLHELASRDPVLAELLAGFTEKVQQRLNEPVAAISWDAQRLVEHLFSMTRERDNPSTARPGGS
jgi:hypothetical protein